MAAAALFLISCHRDEPTPNPETRVTQKYLVSIQPTGDTLMAYTDDYIWENGLLKRIDNTMYVPSSGTTSSNQTIFIYDGTDCIEEPFVSSNGTTNRYYTYSNGRMTSGVEMRNSDTLIKVSINSYTPDGYVQSLSYNYLRSQLSYDYEFTWENGDMTRYIRHHIQPAGESDTVNVYYDSYPNVNAGIPLSDAVFDPQHIASRCSKHNWLLSNTEYSYKNGRLVKGTNTGSAITMYNYYTYSDGTTGRES